MANLSNERRWHFLVDALGIEAKGVQLGDKEQVREFRGRLLS
jgi:hypothetical protein